VVEDRDGVVAVRELDVVGLRAAEPACVVADYAVACREPTDLVVPHAQRAKAAMDQEHRWPVAVGLEVDPSAIHVNEPGFAHQRPSVKRSHHREGFVAGRPPGGSGDQFTVGDAANGERLELG
jgi:hypothetical protein